MKKLFYIVSGLAIAVFGLASCEGALDYSKTIDAAEPLAFLNAGDNNIKTTTITHTPSTSLAEYEIILPLSCNMEAPKDANVTVAFDEAAAQAYIESKGLKATVFPSANVIVRKYDSHLVEEGDPTPSDHADLFIPKGSRVSADSLHVFLTGEFTDFREPEYVLALSLKSDDLSISEQLGNLYLDINTVERLIKPIKSTSDIAGTRPSDIASYAVVSPSGMTSPANLFDNKTNTYGNFPSARYNETVVDMLTVKNLAGFGFACGSSYNKVMYEFAYSVDGVNFTSMGPCSSADQYKSSNNYYFGLYAPVKARYFKFTTDFQSYSSGSSYRRLAEIYLYTAAE